MPVGKSTEMQAHPAVRVDRDGVPVKPDLEPVHHDVLGAKRIARDLQCEAGPRLAAGAHDQRHGADDAVAVGAAIEQAVPSATSSSSGMAASSAGQLSTVGGSLPRMGASAIGGWSAGALSTPAWPRTTGAMPDNLAEQLVHRLQRLDLCGGARAELRIERHEGIGPDPVMLGEQDVEGDDLGAAGRKLLGQPGEVITRPGPGADQLDAFIVDQNDANVRCRQVARAHRLPAVEYAAPHALAERPK